jgi:hypothetical protein
VKVFLDEDNGTGIPKALRLVRAPAAQIVFPESDAGSIIRKGTSDLEWLSWVGTNGFLAISQNIRLMDNPLERQHLLEVSAGVVFIGSGRQPAWKVLRLLLRRWEWLQQIDAHEPRPFAVRLDFAGRPWSYDFVASAWIRR